MHPYLLLYKTLLPRRYRRYLERAGGNTDMCHEALLHGTFYEEYKAYDFASKNEDARRSYLTDAVRDKLCRRINCRAGERIVANKWLTYKQLQQFYHRRIWLLEDSTLDEVVEFASAAGCLVVKPADSCGGRGVQRLARTGKTYTAVALAVRALKNKEVRRIILTRPAVEAGENLGFLPGDLRDKLDPYLQPLYDALRDMIPQQKLLSYWEDNIIEIAPLAFMRGRTLDNAFVILDEAQNATGPQLKMFLTRMGRNAKFVITGDVTQIDLPHHQHSGLTQAISLLSGIKGIGTIQMDHGDVIRHHLVTDIIKAYDNLSNMQD